MKKSKLDKNQQALLVRLFGGDCLALVDLSDITTLMLFRIHNVHHYATEEKATKSTSGAGHGACCRSDTSTGISDNAVLVILSKLALACARNKPCICS